jgi:hypothetical protein
MIRHLKIFLAACLSASCFAIALSSLPMSAADDEIIALDKAATTALSSGDKAAQGKYLDSDFSWVDTKGVMRFGDDSFRAGIRAAVPVADDVKYLEHKYGNVIWLQSNQGKRYSAHFWVKRPAGWKLLHMTEIDVHERDFTTVRPNYEVPCINPCKAVPYTAVTANEKAALDGWQEQESGKEGMWAKHIADNFDQRAAMTWGGPRASKTEMVAMQARARQQNAGKPEVGTAPALFIRSWDFGTAVVMISCQPTYGDKAYWSSRVLAPLDGVWMMMESYHNYIDASPIMTAVPIDQSKDPRAAAMK